MLRGFTTFGERWPAPFSWVMVRGFTTLGVVLTRMGVVAKGLEKGFTFWTWGLLLLGLWVFLDIFVGGGRRGFFLPRSCRISPRMSSSSRRTCGWWLVSDLKILITIHIWIPCNTEIGWTLCKFLYITSLGSPSSIFSKAQRRERESKFYLNPKYLIFATPFQCEYKQSNFFFSWTYI